MAKSYEAANLALNDPTSAVWARTWARFLLRDRPNEVGAWPLGGYEDEELDALLQLDRRQDTVEDGGDDAYYYRPHVTAANLITADPDRATQLSVPGFSGTLRSPAQLVAPILARGLAWDELIASLTDNRVAPQALVLEPAW